MVRSKNELSALDSAETVLQIERAIEEAKESGFRYRYNDYNGFDLAILKSEIEPLLEHAKSLPEYKADASYRARVDELECVCEIEMTKAGTKPFSFADAQR